MTDKVTVAIILATAIVAAAWIMKPPRYEAKTGKDSIVVFDNATGDLWRRVYGTRNMVRIMRKESQEPEKEN